MATGARPVIVPAAICCAADDLAALAALEAWRRVTIAQLHTVDREIARRKAASVPAAICCAADDLAALAALEAWRRSTIAQLHTVDREIARRKAAIRAAVAVVYSGVQEVTQ